MDPAIKQTALWNQLCARDKLPGQKNIAASNYNLS
jgi:hypothetical protein